MNQSLVMELVAAGAAIALLIDYINERLKRRKELETERRIMRICRIYADEYQRRAFLDKVREEIYAASERESA